MNSKYEITQKAITILNEKIAMSSLLVFQRWAKLSDEQRERVAIPLLTRIRFCEKQNIADITSIIFEMIADIQNDKLVDVNNDTVTTV